MSASSYNFSSEPYYFKPKEAIVEFQHLCRLIDDMKSLADEIDTVSNTVASTSGVQTVTDDGLGGITVDNTDPQNPIIGLSVVVDGVTITGDGTTGNPLVATASGGTPAGSTTEIQYNNAGAFGADSEFTRTAQKVTIGGDGTGTDGVLHIVEGDSVSQYIVLEEESGRPGEVYLTFKGTTANAAAMGVLFVAGSPAKYIFTDPSATTLFEIDIATGKVSIRDLTGVGTRMVTASAVGELGTAAIPASVTPAALTKTDDTNVTLTLGGTPATSLLQAVSLTLGWTGTLADARIASAATWNAKLTSVLSSANIFVGNGLNVATGVAMSGDATLANTGALTIANDAVTYAKMQNVSATDKLLGRVSAGSGDVEEVTLDTDGTLAANSDDVVATQKAVKTYVDAQILFSKSSVDQSTTSTALADITNLGISIAANQNIYFKAIIKVGASGTNGARYAVTLPTGATMLAYHAGMNAATVSLAAAQWLTTSGTEGSTINILAVATMVTVIEGWVYNGANAGMIQVQGRSANVANTVTWYSGSMIKGDII